MILSKNTLPSQITASDLAKLASAARESERQRARYILHAGHGDLMQEMVIAITAATYVMPHRQKKRVKSYALLRGALGVLFFDAGGQVVETFTMCEDADQPILLRFDAGRWHSVVSGSDVSIYIETAQGPFEGSEWAEWAPQKEASPEAVSYLELLRQSAFGR